jgi:Ca-activated chloride channel family protein
MIRNVVYIILILLITGSVFGQKERRYIRRGNQDYKKEKFNESEIAYRKAIEEHSDSSDLYKASFNLGDALYKQQKLDEAINQFNNLALDRTKSKDELSKVYHNLGNSYFMSGDFEKSIEAYKDALRKNPDDMETKYNLAYAQHMLKKQQQQQQQNQENQDQQQQEQQEQEQQQNEDQKDDQENKEEQQPQPKENEMTKEEAEKMLKAVQNDENKLQDKLKKEDAKAVNVKVEKDW